jgi:hypothetical protein
MTYVPRMRDDASDAGKRAGAANLGGASGSVAAPYVVPDVMAAWRADSGHCSNDFRKYARSDGDP